MSAATDRTALVDRLRTIVGARYLLTGERRTRRYREGYRAGLGTAIAVARPGTLVELWRVANACVEADVSLIVQASNTGLTGGSSPDGANYPGGVVIISTMRVTGQHLIDDGRQVVCLPGTTLHVLERALAVVGREPHSVIGSSCIGASVIGDICNNSGGALVQRGPAFTQLSLFGQVGSDGKLALVNHLGIRIDGDAECVLQAVEAGDFPPDRVTNDPEKWAHDHAYQAQVRDIDAQTPARFNASPRCLHEGSGSAGKLIMFAVRVDTFERQTGAATFYVGTNDPDALTRLRRALLSGEAPLPIAGEYMHRAAFDLAVTYGKDTFAAIRLLGTERLPQLFKAKAIVDGLVRRVGVRDAGDKLLQAASRLLPRQLPPRMVEFRDRFEHHLILKMPSAALTQTRALLAEIGGSGDWFECTAGESEKAFLYRFAVVSAAVRFRAVRHRTVEEIVALDIALPRNAADWFERLPLELDAATEHKLYYGHFLCHVFHQDYIVKKGHDPIAIEHAMWALLDARGAEYPAEHNVGHLYPAKPALADFYRSLDPRNQLNPGIGKTTKARDWADTGG